MTSAEERLTMPDVQSRPDDRGVMLDQVGVENIRYPVMVLDPDGKLHRTIASISMSVSLPHQVKGTHMSRFIEILHEYRAEMTLRTLPSLLATMRSRLTAEHASIKIAFPYFVQRKAPVSEAEAFVDYDCQFQASLDDTGIRFLLSVEVPVTSLCPCSKEISDYGAHNQRGVVAIEVESANDLTGTPAIIWIEELVDLAERAASSPVYSLLKRSDERHVTMQAYENPVFVEDIVRSVASTLRDDNRLLGFSVKVVNQESIHNHDAFAQVAWRRS